MTKLVALCELAYGGKTSHPGDSFECDNAEDLKILVGLDRARLQDMPPEPDPPPVQTRVLKAEPVAAKPKTMSSSTVEPLTQKRTYKRRDMQAEK